MSELRQANAGKEAVFLIDFLDNVGFSPVKVTVPNPCFGFDGSTTVFF